MVPSPSPAFPAADAEMSKMVGMQRTGNKTLRDGKQDSAETTEMAVVDCFMIFHLFF